MSELFSAVEKAQLERNQGVRDTIITTLMKDNKIPASEEDRVLLMKALDGMDKVNLTKAKIKVEDAAAKSGAAAAAMVGEMLKRVTQRSTNTVREIPPELPEDIEYTPAAGETHIGVKTFQLEDIMRAGKTEE